MSLSEVDIKVKVPKNDKDSLKLLNSARWDKCCHK
jgi:hypothetical protein